jgi:ABC-type lipoprotein release transport system permease subunit
MITGIFGTAGVILSALAALTVNAIGFKAGNAILRVLFGGPVLVLSPGGGTILATLLVVAFISVIAHIYPVVVALRVQPVRAMQSE